MTVKPLRRAANLTRHTVHSRAQCLDLWSHCIFRRYTASLPTSLSCIQSVDQRRLAEETGCGDSVRKPGPGTQYHTGCSVEPVTTRVVHTNGQRRLDHMGSSIDFQHHQRQGCTALLGGGHTPPSVMSIDSPHEPTSGGKENSSGGALPLSLLASIATESPLNRVPSPLQQNVAYACLFANPTRPSSGGFCVASHNIGLRPVHLTRHGVCSVHCRAALTAVALVP